MIEIITRGHPFYEKFCELAGIPTTKPATILFPSEYYVIDTAHLRWMKDFECSHYYVYPLSNQIGITLSTDDVITAAAYYNVWTPPAEYKELKFPPSVDWLDPGLSFVPSSPDVFTATSYQITAAQPFDRPDSPRLQSSAELSRDWRKLSPDGMVIPQTDYVKVYSTTSVDIMFGITEGETPLIYTAKHLRMLSRVHSTPYLRIFTGGFDTVKYISTDAQTTVWIKPVVFGDKTIVGPPIDTPIEKSEIIAVYTFNETLDRPPSHVFNDAEGIIRQYLIEDGVIKNITPRTLVFLAP